MQVFRRNYPSPDVPTENEEKPSTKRVSLDDYFRILTEQMGQQATVIAEIERRTRQAKSRSTGVTVTVADFGNAKAVPEGDWQYVLVNRPGVGERSLTTLQSFRFQLGNRYYTLPASGLSVFPYMGEQDFTVMTDPVSGSTVPTGNWSIEAIFTNRDIASLTSSSVSDLVLPPNLTVQGEGASGTPAGGVLTVQSTPNTNSIGNTPGAGMLQVILNGAASNTNPNANPIIVDDFSADTRPLTQLTGPYTHATAFGFNGSSLDRIRIPAIYKPVAAAAITAGTPVAVWTPASGKKFRLMGCDLSLSVAGSILFEDGSGTVIYRSPSLPAGTSWTMSPAVVNGILSAAANNALYLDVTATGTVNGTVFGTEE